MRAGLMTIEAGMMLQGVASARIIVVGKVLMVREATHLLYELMVVAGGHAAWLGQEAKELTLLPLQTTFRIGPTPSVRASLKFPPKGLDALLVIMAQTKVWLDSLFQTAKKVLACLQALKHQLGLFETLQIILRSMVYQDRVAVRVWILICYTSYLFST